MTEDKKEQNYWPIFQGEWCSRILESHSKALPTIQHYSCKQLDTTPWIPASQKSSNTQLKVGSPYTHNPTFQRLLPVLQREVTRNSIHTRIFILINRVLQAQAFFFFFPLNHIYRTGNAWPSNMNWTTNPGKEYMPSITLKTITERGFAISSTVIYFTDQTAWERHGQSKESDPKWTTCLYRVTTV